MLDRGGGRREQDDWGVLNNHQECPVQQVTLQWLGLVPICDKRLIECDEDTHNNQQVDEKNGESVAVRAAYKHSGEDIRVFSLDLECLLTPLLLADAVKLNNIE